MTPTSEGSTAPGSESADAPAPSSPPPRPGYPCCLPLLRSVPPCHIRPCPRARVLSAVSDPHRKKNRRRCEPFLLPRRLRGLDARRLARPTSFPSYISSLAHRMIRSFIRYCTVSIFATPTAFHFACARAKSVSEAAATTRLITGRSVQVIPGERRFPPRIAPQHAASSACTASSITTTSNDSLAKRGAQRTGRRSTPLAPLITSSALRCVDFSSLVNRMARPPAARCPRGPWARVSSDAAEAPRTPSRSLSRARSYRTCAPAPRGSRPTRTREDAQVGPQPGDRARHRAMFRRARRAPSSDVRRGCRPPRSTPRNTRRANRASRRRCERDVFDESILVFGVLRSRESAPNRSEFSSSRGDGSTAASCERPDPSDEGARSAELQACLDRANSPTFPNMTSTRRALVGPVFHARRPALRRGVSNRRRPPR